MVEEMPARRSRFADALGVLTARNGYEVKMDPGDEALTIIREHQRECERRYGELHASIKDLREEIVRQMTTVSSSVNGLQKRIDEQTRAQSTTLQKAAFTIGGALVTAVGYLLTHGSPLIPLLH